MQRMFIKVLIIFTLAFSAWGILTIVKASNTISPDYGYVVSKHHDNSGYYVEYSDQGSFWYAKINYASYITCKPGMYWQGLQLEICTNTK